VDDVHEPPEGPLTTSTTGRGNMSIAVRETANGDLEDSLKRARIA